MVGVAKHGAGLVQVLGIGGGGGSAYIDGAAMLAVGRQRVLINCNEGIQRFCAEHRTRLSRVSRVLFTRADPHAVGGLPGTLLSLADLPSSPRLQLHGPIAISSPTAASRRLLPSHSPGFDAHLISSPSLCSDDNLLHITSLPLHPPSPRLPKHPRSASPPHPFPSRVCYACRLADLPGKFNPDRAKSLGVPPGPSYSKLVNGQPVSASDGSEVLPGDVLGSSTPGPLALVLDLPTEAYVLELLDSISQLTTELPTCALHMVPEHVVSSDVFKRLVHSFGSGCTNIVINNSTLAPHVPFQSAAMLQGKLHQLDSALFHSPAVPPREDISNEDPVNPSLNDGTELIAGRNMTTFHLRPVNHQGLDRKTEPSILSMDDVKKELREQHSDATDAASRVVAASTRALGTSDQFSVTFLGTGASVPSKYRNVSCIYVDFGEGGTMLLDCGEGTLEQMRACFGNDRLQVELRRLRAIWISHFHADHHVGLSSVLYARAQQLSCQCRSANGELPIPIPLIGPTPLKNYLDDMSRENDLRFEWQDCADTASGLLKNCTARVRAELERLGVQALQSVPVDHCKHAYACVFWAGERQEKLVYSGDTRPCNSLTNAATDASLLVHEATFEDSLVDEAIEKRHSLVKEAVEVGERAGARSTVLTHFSQRYPKYPVMDGSYGSHTGVAFDMLTVSPSTVSRLTNLKEALQILFREDEAEEEALSEEVD